MVKGRYWAFAIVFSFILMIPVFTEADTSRRNDENPTRGELFEAMLDLLSPEIATALKLKFVFPNDARKSAVFGIDFNHYIQDGCHCEVPWDKLFGSGVKYVYFKATEGDTIVDPSYPSNLKKIRSIKNMDAYVGAYMFLRPLVDERKQSELFEQTDLEARGGDLPPAIDLEWRAISFFPGCPNDAVITVKHPDGSKTKYCDEWYKLSSSEIVNKLNHAIDLFYDHYKRKPIVYTNNVWWAARIGSTKKFSEIHTNLLWIADYSPSGRGEEKPSTPNRGSYDLWQFTDSAILTSNVKIPKIDASIFQGSEEDFRSRLDVKVAD